MYWVKRDMKLERLDWEATKGPTKINGVNLDNESSRPPSEQTPPALVKATPEQAV